MLPKYYIILNQTVVLPWTIPQIWGMKDMSLELTQSLQHSSLMHEGTYVHVHLGI